MSALTVAAFMAVSKHALFLALAGVIIIGAVMPSRQRYATELVSVVTGALPVARHRRRKRRKGSTR